MNYTNLPVMPNEIIYLILSFCHADVICSLHVSTLWNTYFYEITKIMDSSMRMHCINLGKLCYCNRPSIWKKSEVCNNCECEMCPRCIDNCHRYGSVGRNLCIACAAGICVNCNKILCNANFYDTPCAITCMECGLDWCDECKVDWCITCNKATIYLELHW